MLKKIKKHKLSLFLLALVAMLSVYYVMLPETKDSVKPAGSDIVVKTRYQPFAEKRMEILANRNESVANCEAKITDVSTTQVEMENYLAEIEMMSNLTENEVYVEKFVCELGFEDALCFLQEENNLQISILSKSFTALDYVKVAKAAKEKFGNKTVVTVNLVSEETN